jgi:hypothetical protein
VVDGGPAHHRDSSAGVFGLVLERFMIKDMATGAVKQRPSGRARETGLQLCAVCISFWLETAVSEDGFMLNRFTLAFSALVVSAAAAWADPQIVTVQNFVRAETDGYFEKNTFGKIGVFEHKRTPTPVDGQQVIRMNRDTLYSSAVFDLSTPVTITLPDAGDRFRSMLIINQDHYVKGVNYAAGDYTLTQDAMGTRYVQVVMRHFIDANDPEDIARTHALQDAITVTQDNPGTLDLPDWDSASRDAVRGLLNQLAAHQDPTAVAFGDKTEVDPVAHLIGTAAGWGANPPSAAIYTFGVPPDASGKTAYTLTMKDVPVDGFWSIIVYNKDGFFEAPVEQASFNSVTAKPETDGSVVIRFGGDASLPNFLRIMDGWNYVVRLYQPRPEILKGEWTTPGLVAVP